MPSKKRKKHFFYDRIFPGIFRLMVYTIPHLPFFIVRFSGHLLFGCLYPIGRFIGLQKRFERNIKRAFQGSQSSKAVARIARRTIHNWLLTLFDVMYFYHPINKEQLVRRVRIDGLEKIKQVMAGGNGALAISAHFGSFPVAILRLKHENIRISFLFRELPQDAIAACMRERSEFSGHKMIFTKSTEDPVAESIKEINQAGLVFVVADEFKKESGIPVRFFNQPTQQAAGPSVIALRTGVKQIPMFIIKEKWGRHRIIVENPIPAEIATDETGAVMAMTQKRMEIIEKYVRKYPDLWLWVHSRWIQEPIDGADPRA